MDTDQFIKKTVARISTNTFSSATDAAATVEFVRNKY